MCDISFLVPNLVAFSCYTVNIHLEKWLMRCDTKRALWWDLYNKYISIFCIKHMSTIFRTLQVNEWQSKKQTFFSFCEINATKFGTKIKFHLISFGLYHAVEIDHTILLLVFVVVLLLLVIYLTDVSRCEGRYLAGSPYKGQPSTMSTLSSYHCWPDDVIYQNIWILLSNVDVIMAAIASQITSLTIVYSTVFAGADQRKHQSSVSLAFVWGIHRWPVSSRTKG